MLLLRASVLSRHNLLGIKKFYTIIIIPLFLFMYSGLLTNFFFIFNFLNSQNMLRRHAYFANILILNLTVNIPWFTALKFPWTIIANLLLNVVFCKSWHISPNSKSTYQEENMNCCRAKLKTVVLFSILSETWGSRFS